MGCSNRQPMPGSVFKTKSASNLVNIPILYKFNSSIERTERERERVKLCEK